MTRNRIIGTGIEGKDGDARKIAIAIGREKVMAGML